MAAKVVFFSSGFVEASPKQRRYITLADKWPSSAVALWRPALKQGRFLRLRMAAKVGLLQQWLCGGQP